MSAVIVRESLGEDKNRFQVLLGQVTANAKDDLAERSENLYIFGGRFLSKPFYLRTLRGGLDIFIGQVLSEDENNPSLTYKEFRGFLSYDFQIASGLAISPRLYGVFADAGNPASSLKMNHQHLGFGAAIDYRITTKMRLELVYVMSGFLATIDTNHSSIQAEFGYQFNSYELGLGLNINSYQFSLVSGNQAAFDQTLLYLSLGF